MNFFFFFDKNSKKKFITVPKNLKSSSSSSAVTVINEAVIKNKTKLTSTTSSSSSTTSSSSSKKVTQKTVSDPMVANFTVEGWPISKSRMAPNYVNYDEVSSLLVPTKPFTSDLASKFQKTTKFLGKKVAEKTEKNMFFFLSKHYFDKALEKPSKVSFFL